MRFLADMGEDRVEVALAVSGGTPRKMAIARRSLKRHFQVTTYYDQFPKLRDHGAE